MQKMTVKKVFSVLITIALVMTFFSACSKNTQTNTETITEDLWETKHYDDGSWYITNSTLIDGTYNDGKTEDFLMAYIFSDNENRFSIQLWEGAKKVVWEEPEDATDYFDGKIMYVVDCVLDDGTELGFYAFIHPHDDKIILDSPDDFYLIEKLKESEYIDFEIQKSSDKSKKYYFRVESGNFADLLEDNG